MYPKAVRLAVRAVIVENNRLLVVNAWPGGKSTLMCTPGGGVEPGQSLPDNLAREVYEETGLRIIIGAVCLINEFHDPGTGFHQVEVFFRCQVSAGQLNADWTDPAAVVTERRWVTASELDTLPHKPDSLGRLAFSPDPAPWYDPLELLTR